MGEVSDLLAVRLYSLKLHRKVSNGGGSLLTKSNLKFDETVFYVCTVCTVCTF